MPIHHKYIWGAVAILMCLAVSLVAYMYVNEQTGPNNQAHVQGGGLFEETEMQTVFRERLTQQAIDIVGQPIEGFNAELLMDAYPGLMPKDFNTVTTYEGLYVFDDDALAFVRDTEAPVSTAERTVSNEGYATLLENLSVRTGASVTNKQEVFDLIDRIAVVEDIRAAIGKGVSMSGITLVPQEVVEDSRCPKQVNCIWAGTVRVRTILKGMGGTSEYVFTLGEPIKTEYATITLSRVLPETGLEGPIEPKSYRFYFQVETQAR